MSSKEEAAAALSHLKEVREEIKDLEDLAVQLSEVIASYDLDDVSFVDERGTTWKGRVQTATRSIVNLPLLTRLNPLLAQRITTTVVSTDLLNSSLDEGLWTEELRDAVVTLKRSRPGVVFTKITAKEEQESA